MTWPVEPYGKESGAATGRSGSSGSRSNNLIKVRNNVAPEADGGDRFDRVPQLAGAFG
jgi:hypothetical protein